MKKLILQSFLFGLSLTLALNVVAQSNKDSKYIAYHAESKENLVAGNLSVSELLPYNADFNNGKIAPAGTITMSMNIRKPYNGPKDEISILASTDFNGKYTLDDIKAATWQDISSRFSIPTKYGLDDVPAGNPVISDLIVDGKPLYVVIKYIESPKTVLVRNNWIFRDLKVSMNTAQGSETLLDQTGFQIISTANKNPGRSSIAANGSVTLRGNNTGTRELIEDWCISGPITKASGGKNSKPSTVAKKASNAKK